MSIPVRPLVCWDYGFESRRGHRYLSLVSVVCCQVEVSVTSWSLVQRSLTEGGVSECDSEASIMRKPWPNGGCRVMKKNSNHTTHIYSHILPTHTPFKRTNINILSRAIHVGFVVENKALGQVSLPIFRLSLVIVIPQTLRTNTVIYRRIS